MLDLRSTKFGAIEVIFPKPPVGEISTIQDLLLRQVNRAHLEILPGALQEFNLNFSKHQWNQGLVMLTYVFRVL
jgi:hypothetical protein